MKRINLLNKATFLSSWIFWLGLLVCLVLIVTPVAAAGPEWTANSSWNTPDVGEYSVPALADLDDDGDYDLMIGAKDGITYGYENTGTPDSPVWTAKSEWNVPDVGSWSSPALADLDCDGDYDLMIGEIGGVTYGYENTGTSDSPVWTAKSEWNTPDVSQNAAPSLADLDGDGDYDLMIGEGYGVTYGYENIGSSGSPEWAANSSWNIPSIGYYSSPALADLDGDYDYDLMMGGYDGVIYGYENTGSSDSPEWAANSSWNIPSVGSRSLPALADLDCDGDYDLMIGESTGITYGYENTAPIIVPLAGFSASPTTGNVPLTVRFTDESANNPASWLWEFGDDTNATMRNPVHTYNAAGTYNVTLTATNIAGNSTESKTGYITVLEAVIPVANFSAEPTTGDVPLTVQFTDESANNPTSWLWDFGDGGDTNATMRNPVHTYNAAGTYNVTLTATNIAGNSSESKTGYITTVLTAVIPVANFSAEPTTGDVPLTVQFTDESANDPTSWLWEFGDDTNATMQSPVHTYNAAGTYNVTLTATNIAGNSSESKTGYITVTGEPIKLADSAWPKFGYDLNNTGQSPYAGPQSNNIVWTYTAGEYFTNGGPSIGPDGTIYINNVDKKLYAFYPNGTLRWTNTTGARSYSTPAIDSDGTLYGGDYNGKLYAVNPDGTFKWEYTTGDKFMGSPAIGSDGIIYAAGYNGNLFAFYSDGTLRWSYSTPGFDYSTPAIATDGTIYIGTYNSYLYAINPDGTLKWTYQVGGEIYNSPAIAADGTIYVGCEDNNLYAINANGTLKWTYTTGAQIYGAPAIGADGTIYVGDYSGILSAINPDGALKWTYEANYRFYSTPVIGSDGTVYIGDYSGTMNDNSGNIYAINRDGTLKWEYATGRIHSSASIGSDGTLYLGSYDNNLYAFRDVADFNAGPKMGGAPLTVQFTDESTGSPTSWLWDFGDGDDTNSTVQNPVHVYTAPGIYNVTLTGADAYHSYSTEKIGYINVTNDSSGVTAPIPSFTTDASSGRVPFTVQFTDTTTGNVSTWSWDFGDGETSDEQNPVHTYVTEGTHTVTLTATGPGGTDTATSTMEVAAPLNTGSYDGGSPLLTVQEGTVSGGLWHGSWPGFSGYGEQTFTLPPHTEIKWARLYADVYCGLMTDIKSFSMTIDIDGDGDGIYELQKHDAASIDYTNTPAWVNDHVVRVTSDYFMWYDLTDNITGNEVNIKATGGGSDGRIKHVTLVVAYDDGDDDEIHYWVNQGHDTANTGSYTGSTVFGTSALSDPDAVNLSSIYCASVNGAYTYNGESLSSGGPQGEYFGYNDWNVTEYFNSGEDSTVTYAPTGSYYKIQLALLTASGAGSSGGDGPVADFTANVTSGGIPLTVSFTDESTGSPASWLWDFGDGNNSTEQNPVHTYSTEGTYSVNLTVTNEDGSDSELKTDYITVTQAGQVATNDLSISGLVNTVPASAVFARETNPVKVLNVQNTGTATLSNISIAVYASDVSSGTVPVDTTTIASLAGDAKTTVTLIDPTIRDLEGGTVTYTAVVDPDNLIAETDETNNNKSSSAKPLRYNGYKGKGIYWEGGSNITTRHTFDLQGNLLYSTQPDSAYQPVGWESRTETWTASDLPVPDGSTIEKAFLYVAYNWDQTPGGYPWLNINFNGNALDNGNISTGNGTLYRDWSNFGAYADYEYGLCVYNVTDKFSSAGNSLVMTPVGENKNALYPSTLVVVYGNDNETRKQIFINEECDELAYSLTGYGTTPEEATAYAPFTGMFIDVEKVQNAMLYSFAGSAGPDEGNLLFNGNIVATNAWQGSSNSGSPLVFDATNYINATGNEAGIQGTTSGGMDALQQILVVEYTSSGTVPSTDFSADPTSGTAPLNVTFTDESAGAPISWSWDFGDGNTSAQQNPSHIYTAPGTYTVNLTVTNNTGSSSVTKTDYISVAGGSTYTVGEDTVVIWNYGSTTWTAPPGISEVEYLVVAGGGGGAGHYSNGGGGAGGFLNGTLAVTPGMGYAIMVGAGGPGGDAGGSIGMNGSDSQFSTVIATGGGAGGNLGSAGLSGGSGGGAGSSTSATLPGGDGVSGQGHAGGSNYPTGGGGELAGGGGGGASGTGGDGAYRLGGDGGDGITSSITGTEVVYACGGGGGANLGPGGTGGSSAVNGGTGGGPQSGNVNGEAGLDSTGTGGGGAGWYGTGGDGGDGIVIIRYHTSVPVAPVAGFLADPTSGTAPLTVQFTDNSTGSPTEWSWDFGDGATSNESSPMHTYSAAGNYTVNLTVENAAGSDFELKSDYIKVSEASGSTVTLYFDPTSSSVSENESIEINLVASNFPAGLSGYNLTVALDGPAVAEIVDIEYPSWALITQNSTLPGSSIYMKTVDLEDSIKEGAADVVLATLTVSGKEKGSANLSIGVKRLEEDSGDSIEPALLTGTIEVTLLSPLPDQEYTPRDLDGDGLYEDLTGNGEFSFVDIVAYFHNMDWIEENMPVEYFDFNGNGRIDFDDVVDMFAMI
ncbi:DUF3344 domain-containing protein [Methanosarcina acetivorans]|nr:DUF3344 domain-containing protein [Methanosarcina acetivorans]